MAAKKNSAEESGSRQAAYSARNRARLVKDAQEVLAEIGPSATIEQIAAHAEVSPTTIYKYFESKDQLFIAALGDLWHSWVSWSFAQTTAKDDLMAVIDTARSFFRVKQTHPHFAQVLHNTMKVFPDFFLKSDEGTAKRVFSELAAAGKVDGVDFDQRYELWATMYSGLLVAVHVSEVFSPTEADVALGIALSVWGISGAKAKKLISRPLNLSPVK